MTPFLRRPAVCAALLLTFVAVVPSRGQSTNTAATTETLSINAKAPTTPFPHFWEKTFGSGRAVLALRQSYRDDLRTVKAATGFESVRFHGIFNDEVGFYDPSRKPIKFAQMAGAQTHSEVSADDTGIYNFSYVDQIYDGLLNLGVKPYVEMSFMPSKMASDPKAIHPFWYHPNVSPPARYDDWDKMIRAFADHLIARYGIEEVATWKFEVWNEPNLDFWQGTPKQPTYFELYDHTARALKSASPRLQIGGPATAQAAWVGDFLKHTHESNVPVDFVSTHVYANDTADNVLHTNENIPRDQMVYRAVKMVHDEIAASAYPHMPLIFSEYNASYANEPNVTDSIYMGPWLANTIRECDGLVENMAYWSFSDVFEEQGVVEAPFYGGFGLLAEDNIPKPSFNAFALLHLLGEGRIQVNSDSALATRMADGSLVIALWNYAPPVGTGAAYTPTPASLGPDKTFHLALSGISRHESVAAFRVDATHGNVLAAFDAMGRPATPSREQIRVLQAAGKLAAAEHLRLHDGSLDLTVPAQGLVLLKFGASHE